MIKKLTIKLWQFLTTPHKIKKVKETASFLKHCEYYQQEIERLFNDGFFDLTNGSIEYNKDWQGKIRGKAKIIKYV